MTTMPMQVVESSYDPEADAATIYFVRDPRSYRAIVVDEARFFDDDAEGGFSSWSYSTSRRA